MAAIPFSSSLSLLPSPSLRPATVLQESRTEGQGKEQVVVREGGGRRTDGLSATRIDPNRRQRPATWTSCSSSWTSALMGSWIAAYTTLKSGPGRAGPGRAGPRPSITVTTDHQAVLRSDSQTAAASLPRLHGAAAALASRPGPTRARSDPGPTRARPGPAPITRLEPQWAGGPPGSVGGARTGLEADNECVKTVLSTNV